MFDAVFSKAVDLKKIFNALQDVLKEVSLDCSADRIEVMGMDNSHVALVNLKIQADTEGPLFDSYRCDKNTTLSFKVEIINKILKTVGNDDTVQMIADDDGRTCKFVCTDKQRNRTSTFNVNLLELENEHLGVPDEDYETEIQMPSAEFAKMMKDLSIHGETLQLKLDKETLKFSVKGDDASMEVEVKERRPQREIDAEERVRAMENQMKPEEVEDGPAEDDAEKKDDVEMDEAGESLEEVKKEMTQRTKAKAKKVDDKEKETEGEDPNLTRVAFTVAEPVETIYSLRYMTMFATAAPLANYVKLSVSGEQPIIAKFPLGQEEHGHLSFYLAPKIDE